MWLISKPKGKGKRKQPKKNHQEDSDNAEDLSDGDGEFGDGNGGEDISRAPRRRARMAVGITSKVTGREKY